MYSFQLIRAHILSSQYYKYLVRKYARNVTNGEEGVLRERRKKWGLVGFFIQQHLDWLMSELESYLPLILQVEIQGDSILLWIIN